MQQIEGRNIIKYGGILLSGVMGGDIKIGTGGGGVGGSESGGDFGENLERHWCLLQMTQLLVLFVRKTCAVGKHLIFNFTTLYKYAQSYT